MKYFILFLILMPSSFVRSQSICVSVDCKDTIRTLIDTLTLNGKVSSAGGYTTLWQSVQGNANITAPIKESTTAVGLTSPGTYVFSLTANNSSATAIAYDTVVYLPPAINKPPVAIILAVPNVSTVSVGLDATGSYDPDGTVVKYGWGKLSGPGTQVIQNAATAKPIINGLQTGQYIFKVTIWDDAGATGFATVTFNVSIAQKIITKIIVYYQDGTSTQVFP